MTTEQHQNLEDIVRRVIAQLGTQPAPAEPVNSQPAREEPPVPAVAQDAEIPDMRAVDYRDVYKVPNPAKPEEFVRLKARTWARLGLGRTGPRYTTAAQLRFWADQAAAMDAVFTDVAPDWLERAGLFMVQTKCTSRDQYLTNPELGTQFDDATLAELRDRCQRNPEVQVFVADGLSSTSVEANVIELLPALQQGLQLHGLTMGTPFFVKYGRVRSMEPISEALGAKVTCVLVGERPGLACAESLSAYLAYQARVGMSEAERTCVSNIHNSGSNPIEAGAHLADLIHQMIQQQASGINLKL
ncbi:MAG: ethanolamine ammonia-lyase subunit EutC [Propionibacteriaceae bacterium]|nr:ethanolamine ammonia-lyase subunit EutC [Propionibacteriaceae bacterium]